MLHNAMKTFGILYSQEENPLIRLRVMSVNWSQHVLLQNLNDLLHYMQLMARHYSKSLVKSVNLKMPKGTFPHINGLDEHFKTVLYVF